MTGAELLTRAAVLLQDEAHTRWRVTELVKWANDGLDLIVSVKPSANAHALVLSLAYGTRQELPATAMSLLRITRNITSESPQMKGGRVVRPTTREMLDATAPDWHDPICTPYKQEVRQYIYDEADPRAFYVYPGNLGTGKIEAIVAKYPTKITVAGSGDPESAASYSATLDLKDPYGIILVDYVCYRAQLKDDMDGSSARAQIHLQLFMAALGIKGQVENQTSPNARQKVEST